ncbi:hypothetical protein AB1F70_08295 [Pseudomonas asiatica]
MEIESVHVLYSPHGYTITQPITGKPAPTGTAQSSSLSRTYESNCLAQILKVGAISVGDRTVLWAALSRKELNSQAVRVPCGSGFSREESNAVHGTGCAGVRG